MLPSTDCGRGGFPALNFFFFPLLRTHSCWKHFRISMCRDSSSRKDLSLLILKGCRNTIQFLSMGCFVQLFSKAKSQDCPCIGDDLITREQHSDLGNPRVQWFPQWIHAAKFRAPSCGLSSGRREVEPVTHASGVFALLGNAQKGRAYVSPLR